MPQRSANCKHAAAGASHCAAGACGTAGLQCTISATARSRLTLCRLCLLLVAAQGAHIHLRTHSSLKATIIGVVGVGGAAHLTLGGWRGGGGSSSGGRRLFAARLEAQRGGAGLQPWVGLQGRAQGRTIGWVRWRAGRQASPRLPSRHRAPRASEILNSSVPAHLPPRGCCRGSHAQPSHAHDRCRHRCSTGESRGIAAAVPAELA